MHPGLLAGGGVPVVDALCDGLVEERGKLDKALLRLFLLLAFHELDEVLHERLRPALDHLVPKASFFALSVAFFS